jgi:hypothetical protein
MRLTRVAAVSAVLAAVTAILVAAIAAQATRSSNDVKIDVQQSAQATDQGVTLAVDGATFSGTSAYLSMSADTSAFEGATDITAVAIPADGFKGGGLALPPTVPAVEVRKPSEPAGPIRLTPMTATGEPTIYVTALNLTSAAKGTVRVNGNWVLTLVGPPDRTRALRVQDLAASGSSTADGISLTVLSARRSTSETIVTVQASSSESFAALDQAVLLVGQETLHGRISSSDEQGHRVELVFPATAFDSPALLKWSPFAIPGSGAARSVSVDIGGAMQRQGMSAKFGEKGAITPDDVTDLSSEGISIRSFDFARTSAGAPADILALSVAGNWTNPEPATLVTAGGESLELLGTSDNHPRDAAGNVSEGITRLMFKFDSPAQVAGQLTLTLPSPDEVVAEDLEVSLTVR